MFENSMFNDMCIYKFCIIVRIFMICVEVMICLIEDWFLYIFIEIIFFYFLVYILNDKLLLIFWLLYMFD